MANSVRRASATLRSIIARALPQVCALCADRSGDAMVCAPCMNALPPLPPACPVCAAPSPASAVCGACLKRPPKFAATLAACAYLFPLDRLVQALKYEHRLALAEPLGDALAAAALRVPDSIARPDALIALPLAPARQRERGFNQSVEIARVVGRRTGLPLVTGLVRTGDAPAQATLPWAQRRRNVRGAFACATSFAGQHVAVVDDVMTTGATLEAAAAALVRSGAARVDAWVVARTLPPGHN
jgi:ComF family protein